MGLHFPDRDGHSGPGWRHGDADGFDRVQWRQHDDYLDRLLRHDHPVVFHPRRVSGSFTPIGGNSPTVNTGPLTQTTYFRAQVGTASPCSLADSTTPGVTVNALPAAPTAGNNGPVCAGSTLSLTASIVAGATYAWTGPNSFTSADQNPTIPTATTAATGTYSVTTTVAGCTSAAGTTAATVTAPSLASVTISNLIGATLTYGGGAGSQFVLLKSASVTAPLSGWDRLLTNNATPGTFDHPGGGHWVSGVL